MKTYFGACPHDCQDGCSMIYTVTDGKLTGVRGNPDQPYTQGRLCVKVKDYDKHHYNPDRVIHPLRRNSNKGDGNFTRISWDDALAEIKSRWDEIIIEYGADAILPYGYVGNVSILNGGMQGGDAFFNRLGASISEKTFCASSAATSQLMTIGASTGTDPESFSLAKYIVLWGSNTLTTNTHMWPFILKARKNGAKVAVVDPYRTRTAKQADLHLPLLPGTDGALALGMIHVLIREELLDNDYIADYTLGFDELKAVADRYDPERVAHITGLSAQQIRDFARDYAATQPSVIRMGIGPERYAGGGQAMRIVDCLPALVGAWRYPGGGLLQMPIFDPIRADRISRPDWIKENPRIINLTRIADVLTNTHELDPPVKSLFVWNANPLSQAPNSNTLAKGLAREDLFTVVSEQFMTDTAAYADIVLPATMAGEHFDCVSSWGNFYINLNEKAVDPPGEAVSNTELFRRLAKTMGFDDEQFRMTDEALLEHFLDWDSPLLAGYDMELLKKQGFLRLNLPAPETYTPHAEGNFPTPSGKCEFVSSLGEQGGFIAPPLRHMYEGPQKGEPIPRVPDYIENRTCTVDSVFSGDNQSFQLLSPKSHGFLNSEYANEDHKRRGQGEQTALINPVDASNHQISEGDKVRIRNELGELSAVAKITDDVRKGLIVATFGYWRSLNGGGAVNSLTGSRHPGFAGTPEYYDTRVMLEKC